MLSFEIMGQMFRYVRTMIGGLIIGYTAAYWWYGSLPFSLLSLDCAYYSSWILLVSLIIAGAMHYITEW